MKNEIKYIQYLLKHKWYVMLECFKYGLIWRGIAHDISKFYPDEFFPYVNFFYGKNLHICNEIERKNGYCKPTETENPDFDFAWFLHSKRNKHHWQWWAIPNDKGGTKILPIQEPYLTEMLCDWVGAGKAQGHKSPKEDPYLNVREWYTVNHNKLQFAEETRKEIERRIGYYIR